MAGFDDEALHIAATVYAKQHGKEEAGIGYTFRARQILRALEVAGYTIAKTPSED
ncbi:hypothetical protein O4273_23990 [Rhodococcus ruber]|uniref:hypothetical protein n=1 Tax=Rhodococcus ruber TaxID=1830 RepID=UPI0022B4C7F0|nr:hypothetical protein [Rhodococcus ruber]MCZ4505895.1 hypothetical protein [Rhodococcus ruber]